MIVGIDAGNNEVKVMGSLGVMKFPSTIGAYRERNLTNKLSQHDMIVEYKGRKVFAGSLAEESFLGGAIMGQSKAHEDALLRIIIALHRYSNSSNYDVIVGQPIGMHKDEEKRAIKEMLQDTHEITINEETRKFRITRAEVAAEGGAAFWSAPTDGTVRLIDLGSGTVNCATIKNRKYLDLGSFSLPFGMNTVGTEDMREIARGIVSMTSAKKWQKNDKVLLIGGVAKQLVDPMRKYYPKSEVIKPVIKTDGGVQVANPIYANAIGFYHIGKAVFGG